MGVCVDRLRTYSPESYCDPQAARVGARNGHRWCHMFSDGDDDDDTELHRVAIAIGMRRAWFQGDHYDLTPGRRAAAVRVGAREVDDQEAVEIWRCRRELEEE